jgi:NAD(P)-dependent dehydrogenase (short-subunit alcohol dehydrogenase family)
LDLGIKGRRAIVCASSKGLGRACAMALANEGVHVTLTARGAEALNKTADEIRKANPGVTVTEIIGDITTPAGREAVLKACPDPDILVNNASGPPPGDFRNWTRDDWIKAVDANMLTPIELIKATVDGMMARKFGRIVNITSSAVKAPIEVLGLSNGARAGLTGFVAGLSRKTVIITSPSMDCCWGRSIPTACAARSPRWTPTSAASRWISSWPRAPSSIPPGALGIPMNSARPAPSCAAPRRASLPARTSCSTAARSQARSK